MAVDTYNSRTDAGSGLLACHLTCSSGAGRAQRSAGGVRRAHPSTPRGRPVAAAARATSCDCRGNRASPSNCSTFTSSCMKQIFEPLVYCVLLLPPLICGDRTTGRHEGAAGTADLCMSHDACTMVSLWQRHRRETRDTHARMHAHTHARTHTAAPPAFMPREGVCMRTRLCFLAAPPTHPHTRTSSPVDRICSGTAR